MTLILLPNILAEGANPDLWLPASVGNAVRSLNGLICESEKGGRAFLRLFGVRDLPQRLLNEHTQPKELDELLKPLSKGETWGVVSDCGLPCLADPGAALVRRAQALKISVEALSGPSSITLALMLSGLPGQSFAFHGYLERDEDRLRAQIRALEKRSLQEKETQVFIEAPYRNQKLIKRLIEDLHEKTLLSAACDLTLSSQEVVTQSAGTWRKRPVPDLAKRPAVFLFAARVEV
jgi:16S rRNA (cytidine1402-2'-O)-methyltransferase